MKNLGELLEGLDLSKSYERPLRGGLSRCFLALTLSSDRPLSCFGCALLATLTTWRTAKEGLFRFAYLTRCNEQSHTEHDGVQETTRKMSHSGTTIRSPLEQGFYWYLRYPNQLAAQNLTLFIHDNESTTAYALKTF